MVAATSPLFANHFTPLSDPRIERSRLHPLHNVIFIAICAMVSGVNDFLGMEAFGKAKYSWLEKYLDLSQGIPSHDTFNRVISRLDPDEFVGCFLSWVRALETSSQGEIIAIDGKTARASGDAASNQNPLHVVSAWANANHLVLGQEAVDAKSNEITAVPRLLEAIDVAGGIVTLDALGCQKEIAAKIRERKADYVLAVKGNQEHLEEDIVEAFAAVDEERSTAIVDIYETQSKGHGREERRVCDTMPVPDDLRNLDAWKDLTSIGRVMRVWWEKGEEKFEVRYFISSLTSNAQRMAEAVRGHWGVENKLHWSLDMYFEEDRQRARTQHARENLALLRRWVLSQLRRDTTSQSSLPKKRLEAALTDRVREAMLGLA